MPKDDYADYLRMVIRIEEANVNMDPASVWSAARLSAFKAALREYCATHPQE